MDKKTTTALIVAVLVLLLDLALYTFKPLGGNFYIISDVLVIIYALAAAIIGFYTAKSSGASPLHKKALYLIVTGVFLWMIGEALWGFQEIILKMENPFPSIADAFWIIGYLFVFYGIYLIYQIAKTQYIKIGKVISLIIFMTVLFIALTHFIYPSVVDPQLTAFGKAIILVYFFFDLILVLLVVTLLYLFYTSKIIHSWVWIGISLIFLTIADFLYMGLAESYTSGLPFGMLWDAHYIMLAFSFFYYKNTIETLAAKAKT